MVSALFLTGCIKQQTEAERAQERLERLEEQQRRIDSLNAQANACVKNDGIADVQETKCSRYGCDAVMVTCKDGMSKTFPKL